MRRLTTIPLIIALLLNSFWVSGRTSFPQRQVSIGTSTVFEQSTVPPWTLLSRLYPTSIETRPKVWALRMQIAAMAGIILAITPATTIGQTQKKQNHSLPTRAQIAKADRKNLVNATKDLNQAYNAMQASIAQAAVAINNALPPNLGLGSSLPEETIKAVETRIGTAVAVSLAGDHSLKATGALGTLRDNIDNLKAKEGVVSYAEQIAAKAAKALPPKSRQSQELKTVIDQAEQAANQQLKDDASSDIQWVVAPNAAAKVIYTSNLVFMRVTNSSGGQLNIYYFGPESKIMPGQEGKPVVYLSAAVNLYQYVYPNDLASMTLKISQVTQIQRATFDSPAQQYEYLRNHDVAAVVNAFDAQASASSASQLAVSMAPKTSVASAPAPANVASTLKEMLRQTFREIFYAPEELVPVTVRDLFEKEAKNDADTLEENHPGDTNLIAQAQFVMGKDNRKSLETQLAEAFNAAPSAGGKLAIASVVIVKDINERLSPTTAHAPTRAPLVTSGGTAAQSKTAASIKQTLKTAPPAPPKVDPTVKNAIDKAEKAINRTVDPWFNKKLAKNEFGNFEEPAAVAAAESTLTGAIKDLNAHLDELTPKETDTLKEVQTTLAQMAVARTILAQVAENNKAQTARANLLAEVDSVVSANKTSWIDPNLSVKTRRELVFLLLDFAYRFNKTLLNQLSPTYGRLMEYMNSLKTFQQDTDKALDTYSDQLGSQKDNLARLAGLAKTGYDQFTADMSPKAANRILPVDGDEFHGDYELIMDLDKEIVQVNATKETQDTDSPTVVVSNFIFKATIEGGQPLSAWTAYVVDSKSGTVTFYHTNHTFVTAPGAVSLQNIHSAYNGKLPPDHDMAVPITSINSPKPAAAPVVNPRRARGSGKAMASAA